mgnify:CR=1 FL=1
MLRNSAQTHQGTGAATISAQVSHTFNTAGNYTVTAILTDNEGGVSTVGPCSQVVSIDAEELTPTPTVKPPGPGDTIMTLGAVGAIISIVGILLIFAL